jgi:hypothetical protein
MPFEFPPPDYSQPEMPAEVPAAANLPDSMDLQPNLLGGDDTAVPDITAPADRGRQPGYGEPVGHSDSSKEGTADSPGDVHTEGVDPSEPGNDQGGELPPPDDVPPTEGSDTPEGGPRGEALKRLYAHADTSRQRLYQALVEGVADMPQGPAMVKEAMANGYTDEDALEAAGLQPVAGDQQLHSLIAGTEEATTRLMHGEDLAATGLEYDVSIGEGRLRLTDAAAFADALAEVPAPDWSSFPTDLVDDDFEDPANSTGETPVDVAVASSEILRHSMGDLRRGTINLHPDEAAAYCPDLPELEYQQDRGDIPLEMSYTPNVPLDLPAQADRLADQLDRLDSLDGTADALRLLHQAGSSNALVAYSALADVHAIGPSTSQIGTERLNDTAAWDQVYQIVGNMHVRGVDPAFTAACCQSILNDIDQTLTDLTTPSPASTIRGRLMDMRPVLPSLDNPDDIDTTDHVTHDPEPSPDLQLSRMLDRTFREIQAVPLLQSARQRIEQLQRGWNA